jgi:hypothetical protein
MQSLTKRLYNQKVYTYVTNIISIILSICHDTQKRDPKILTPNQQIWLVILPQYYLKTRIKKENKIKKHYKGHVWGG